MSFLIHEHGAEVYSVMEDMPAAVAGLEVGDVIVEVEGVEVSTLDDAEFVQTMTGAEGSQVTFTVLYRGDDGWEEEDHVVTREVLEH